MTVQYLDYKIVFGPKKGSSFCTFIHDNNKNKNKNGQNDIHNPPSLPKCSYSAKKKKC